MMTGKPIYFIGVYMPLPVRHIWDPKNEVIMVTNTGTNFFRMSDSRVYITILFFV